MTSPLSDFVALTMVNDGDAPPEAVPFAGRVFLFPPEYLTAIGSGPGSPGFIPHGTVKIRGYHRVEANGTHSWVMTSEVTAVMRTALLAAPSGLGWIDQSLAAGTPLRVARTQVQRLVRDYGVPAAELLDDPNGIVVRLIRAGATNRDQQIAAGG